jgi:hypothetical protein
MFAVSSNLRVVGKPQSHSLLRFKFLRKSPGNLRNPRYFIRLAYTYSKAIDEAVSGENAFATVDQGGKIHSTSWLTEA